MQGQKRGGHPRPQNAPGTQANAPNQAPPALALVQVQAPKVAKTQNRTFQLFKGTGQKKALTKATTQYKAKKQTIKAQQQLKQQLPQAQQYFTKANDVYSLGSSCPSLYCCSVDNSEMVTHNTTKVQQIQPDTP